jgi:hypothetical protein
VTEYLCNKVAIFQRAIHKDQCNAPATLHYIPNLAIEMRFETRNIMRQGIHRCKDHPDNSKSWELVTEDEFLVWEVMCS